MSSINMPEYMRNRRAKRREKLLQLLGGKCVVCGTTEQLEFDHIDWRTKSFMLSGHYLDTSWDKIIEEAKKCQLLCYKDHRLKTVAEGRTGGGHNKIASPEHGTSKMYHHFKCKCDKCRQWKKDYRAKKVDSRGKRRSQVRSLLPERST